MFRFGKRWLDKNILAKSPRGGNWTVKIKKKKLKSGNTRTIRRKKQLFKLNSIELDLRKVIISWYNEWIHERNLSSSTKIKEKKKNNFQLKSSISPGSKYCSELINSFSPCRCFRDNSTAFVGRICFTLVCPQFACQPAEEPTAICPAWIRLVEPWIQIN